MNINSIQNSSAAYGMHEPRRSQPLTDDQKSQVKDILSQFDSENLTQEDAKSIFTAFREAGIQPGRDLAQTITDAGFDAEQIRTLARPEGGRPPGPPPGGGPVGGPGGGPGGGFGAAGSVNKSALQTLQSILQEYDLTNLSRDQETELLGKLNESGLLQGGSAINIFA